MAFPVLPPKYYLDHFYEFLAFLEAHYKDLMEESQIQFIADFRSLSEDAQCLYVRMINRKGRIFFQDAFLKYKEVENVPSALIELLSHGFAGTLQSEHTHDLLSFFSKAELKKWFAAHQLDTRASWSREQFQALGEENLATLRHTVAPKCESLIVQKREAEMEYLLFLYFGSIQKTLGLYALRDLGIRQSNTLKTTFKSRFANREEARAEFFFAKQLDRLFADFNHLSKDEIVRMIEKARGYKDLKSSTQRLKNDLFFRLGEYFIDDDEDLGLQAWQESRHPEAREKRARYFQKKGRLEECRLVLEEILQNPRTDVELIFAEDFLARKFGKKRTGSLSDVLNSAQEITLSDAFFKKPELGVQDHYRKQGFRAQFTENHLWLTLFGVLFWDELFESEEASIYNPFERSPADLVGPDFYKIHQKSLESKLSLLKDPKAIQAYLLKMVTKHYGRLNDVFLWRESVAESLIDFSKKTVDKNVAHILRTMAKNFEYHHSGFPDLIVEKEDQIRFVEVKAEGDSLRANQLSRIRLLKEAGFEVDVLRVNWQVDPNQIYVVVDVETTGGSAFTHRVTEVAAIKIQNGQVIDEFQSLINPQRPIPKMIAALTGITNEMVAEAPTFQEIADSLYEFFESSIFVAHNVRFDYSFIQREFARVEKEFVRPNLCTVSGMRKAYPGLTSYGLKNLTEHFGIALDRHHRALSDARAASQLFRLMKGMP